MQFEEEKSLTYCCRSLSVRSSVMPTRTVPTTLGKEVRADIDLVIVN